MGVAGMFNNKFRVILIAALLSGATGLVQAVERLMPFVPASTGPGDVATTISDVKGRLTGAGFDVAGEYSPYESTTITDSDF